MTSVTPPESFFRVTREWINAHRTPGGHFKRRQIRLICQERPLRTGWIDRAHGLIIPASAAELFEAFSTGVDPVLPPKPRRVNPNQQALQLTL